MAFRILDLIVSTLLPNYIAHLHLRHTLHIYFTP